MSKSMCWGVVTASLLGLFGVRALAGTLNAQAPYTSSNSAMHTAEDIYQRLSTGATNNARNGAFTEPSAGPTLGTMHTLNDIYAIAIPTQVPKTGMTTSYDTNFPPRDDGALQRGLAWPTPRLINNGNGTVTDNQTGLIWLRDMQGAGVGNATNWQGALNWVNELNSKGTMRGHYAGDTSNGGTNQTDWRLPQYYELLSLVDISQTNSPYLPLGGQTFTNTQGYYWSSTTQSGSANTNSAWYVNFAGPSGGQNTKVSNSRYVLPVRGGH